MQSERIELSEGTDRLIITCAGINVAIKLVGDELTTHGLEISTDLGSTDGTSARIHLQRSGGRLIVFAEPPAGKSHEGGKNIEAEYGNAESYQLATVLP